MRLSDLLREVVFVGLGLLLLILGRDPRLWRAIHLVAWGVATALSLALATRGFSGWYWALWGSWLYFGVAASALAGQVLALARRRTSELTA